VNDACNQVLKNKRLLELLNDSIREKPFYIIDDKTKINLKLKPDCICNNFNTIIDFKTTTSFESFRYDMFKYKYNISAAFYQKYLKKENYLFVAIKKEKPVEIDFYQFSDTIIEKTKEDIEMYLDLLYFCKENNYYPTSNEFYIMKECYKLGNLNEFFNIIKNSNPNINIVS
ncbi:MAG: PD-(D/E)XK nuclease-like domain-containing protein, partial [Candidatus Woesearchaeota archaeon]